MAQRKRHIAKAFSWRIFTGIYVGLLVWIVTGEFKAASIVFAFDFVIKLVLYYFHERMWHHIKWGKSKKKMFREISEQLGREERARGEAEKLEAALLIAMELNNDAVTSFCKRYIYPQYKDAVETGWEDYEENSQIKDFFGGT